MKNDNSRNSKSKEAIITALFVAIEIIFCFTPIGSIPLGPGIVATLAHIPVIISALILSKKYSITIGFVMGMCSFIWWSTTGIAYPTAFAFTPFAQNGNILSLIVCFAPRILLPIFTSLIYFLLTKRYSIAISSGLSASIATFLHSAMVLSLIYMFYSGNEIFLESLGKNFLKFLLAWSGVNAIVEIAAAGLISTALIKPLNAIKNNNE